MRMEQTAIINMTNYNCDFPAIKSESVSYIKGLFENYC